MPGYGTGFGGGFGAPGTQGTLGGWWQRVGATLVDGLVLLVPELILLTALGAAHAVVVGYLLALAVNLAYQVLMLSGGGQTVGNKAVHTKVVDATTGALPGTGQVVIRWVVMFALGLLLGVGTLLDYLWPLWDSRNQTIHDKAAQTIVIRV